MSELSRRYNSIESRRFYPTSSTLLVIATVVIGFAFVMAEHHLQHEERTLEIKEPTRARQIGVASIGLLGCALLVFPGGRPLRIDNSLAMMILAFAGLCLASVYWSHDASFTIRRLTSALFFFACAIGLCRHLCPTDFCRLVLFTCLSFLVAGIISELTGRGYTMESYRYRFGGTVNPNLQGTYCALLGMSAVCLLRGAEGSRTALKGILVLAVAFIILTGSRTSLYSFVAAIGCYWWLTTSGFRKAIVLTGLPALGILGVVLYELIVGMSADGFLGFLAMGRDTDTISTMTSRVPVWDQLLPYILDKPLVGYGYQGFWTEARLYEMADFAGWAPGSAHNAFLETILSVGLIGGSLHFLIMLIGLVRARKNFLLTADPGYGFIFCVLIFAFVHSVAESAFSKPLYPGMIFVAGLAILAFPRDVPVARPRMKSLRGARERSHV